MANRKPFEIDEWYHCFSRGVDKRRTFQSKADYERFIQILYLSNSIQTIQRSNLQKRSYEKIFEIRRGEPLVAIAAYCLMPNHFHLLLKEVRENGIALFMQKVGIAYAMYFNIKNDRTGNLFVKPFRSKHIADDVYLKRVVQYIHLNPVELFESGWKTGEIDDIESLESRLIEYRYSSLSEYLGNDRVERKLLDPESISMIMDELPPLTSLLFDMAEYYKDLKFTT